jgi:hypothetical protein
MRASQSALIKTIQGFKSRSDHRVVRKPHPKSTLHKIKRCALGHRTTVNGRSRTQVAFKAILFAAFSSPCVAHGCHNVHGGRQNQPPSASPMIVAAPWAARAAVKRQMRAARSSWSLSKRKRCQTSSGRSKFFESTDSSLPVVAIRS